MSGSPARRAATIAIEYATTPPAATAALACAGPARKTALQFIVADSTNIEQKVRNAGSASAPLGQREVRGLDGGVLRARQQLRRQQERGDDDADRDGRELRAHADARGRGSRRDAGADEQAEAPRAVQRRQDGTAEAMLDRDAVRVRGDVDDAPPRAEQARRRHERANDGANAVAVSAAATTSSPSRIGPRLPRRDASQPALVSSSVATSETARMTRPSSAAVEAEPVLDRRQPRNPGPVDRAERDERHRNRDVRVPKLLRRCLTPRRGV